MSANLTLAVKSIKSIDDSTEWGSDAPYVLVTAANLKALPPQVEVTLYGPWSDVDKGETHGTLVLPEGTPKAVADVFAATNVMRQPFWGLDNKTAMEIHSPNDVAFIVSVMERDDGKPGALRTMVKLAAVGSLAGSMGMSRATRVQKMIADIKGVIKTPTGAPNFDDVVGTHELTLTATDLERPASGTRVKKLNFSGGDEGTFEVAFELKYAS